MFVVQIEPRPWPGFFAALSSVLREIDFEGLRRRAPLLVSSIIGGSGRVRERLRDYSLVVGSITERTWATEFAGNPPCLACSRTVASSGAM